MGAAETVFKVSGFSATIEMTCYAACFNNKLKLHFNALRDIFNVLYNEEDSGKIWELL